jgi:hypothetical protein
VKTKFYTHAEQRKTRDKIAVLCILIFASPEYTINIITKLQFNFSASSVKNCALTPKERRDLQAGSFN